MNSHLGKKEITLAYIGSRAISEMRLGVKLIWESVSWFWKGKQTWKGKERW